MSIFVKNKQKYGADIASYIEGAVTHSKSVYDCWTFQNKTRSAREKKFNKLFGGSKKNYKPEHLLSLN